jgi:hypothetical protein
MGLSLNFTIFNHPLKSPFSIIPKDGIKTDEVKHDLNQINHFLGISRN